MGVARDVASWFHRPRLDRLEHGPEVIVMAPDHLDVCRHGLPVQSLGLGDLAGTNPETAAIVEAWPGLAEAIRKAIVTLVKAAG